MIRARRGMRRAQSAECGAARLHARHGRPALEIPYDRPYVAPAASGLPALRAVLGRGRPFSERWSSRSAARHSRRPWRRDPSPAAGRSTRAGRLLSAMIDAGSFRRTTRSESTKLPGGGHGGGREGGRVRRHTNRPPAAQARGRRPGKGGHRTTAYRSTPCGAGVQIRASAHPGQGSPPRCADTPASPSLVSAAAAGVSTGRKDV